MCNSYLKGPHSYSSCGCSFLSETLVDSNKIEEIKRSTQFDYSLAVDREGRGGGVAILWEKNFNCRVVSYSKHFIYMVVNDFFFFG